MAMISSVMRSVPLRIASVATAARSILSSPIVPSGHFPGADCPLAVAQIDHTPMDVIVVDEEHRQPIQRPSL